MAFGLGRLRLAPDLFWAMTPRELASAMAAVLPQRETVPARTTLKALMARFPDEKEAPRWPSR